MSKSKHTTREDYLLAAVKLSIPIFKSAGVEIPPVRVSTGWPSSRGTSSKRKAIGECWDKKAASDKVSQIFISPWMEGPVHLEKNDSMGVLPTLEHELVHAVLGTEAGHGAKFRKLALAIGLEGKMTSTHAGAELTAKLAEMSKELGDYPHSKLNPSKSGKKKQGTRMVKCECAECGYILRTSKKWIEVAIPSCPSGHGKMDCEVPDEEDAD